MIKEKFPIKSGASISDIDRALACIRSAKKN